VHQRKENTGGFASIIYQVNGSVADIALNRPDKHNAISLEMMRELRAAIQLADTDDSVNVMVLRGEGDRTFSAGIDLEGGILDEANGITVSMRRDLLPLLECMEQSRKMIIASVEGEAFGLGCSLALQCDLLAMSDQSSLNLTFSKLGLIADGGINWQLPRKVGYSRALQMVLEAQVLEADRCLELGIANKVMPRSSMAQEVADWATQLAGRESLAQGFTKQLMRGTMAGTNLLDTVRKEAEIQAVCAASEFFKKIYTSILSK